MKLKNLIDVLQNAINSGAFKPDSNIQIDIGDNTYWDMSVDVSAVAEPRVVVLNINEED
jgi:hypothetical protein